MGSSARMAGGVATAVLAGMALARSAPSVAQAAVRQIVRVPCSASALSTSINAANATPATLRLAARCTYEITDTLTVTGTIALFGGPSTTISPASGFVGRLLDVGSTGRLRVQGISILGGTGARKEEGTGIRNAGRLVLNFVTLGRNTADGGNGAGLANLEGALAFVAHTFIGGNNATGTGVAGSGLGAGVLNRGSLTLFASRVSANTAEQGGGIDTEATGTTRIIQSTVDHNAAALNGGGIANSGSTSLDRTLVVRNRAGLTGDGIQQNGGTIAVRFSIIRANLPDNCSPAGSVPGCGG